MRIERGPACGEFFGPPLCAGECSADAPLCVYTDDGCECKGEPESVKCGDYADPLFSGFPICAGECPPEHVCIPGGESCECIEFPEIPCDLHPLICEGL